MRSVLLYCALVGISLALCSCTEKSTYTAKVGQHNIVVSRSVPRSRAGDHDGSSTLSGPPKLTYKSGDLKVTVENEVLTVNGKTYVIPHKDDSIKIVDDRAGIRVEINGQLAKPEGGS